MILKGDSEAYDNEEDYGSQKDGPEEENQDIMYMSQQPEEVYDIVMDPLKVELENYLMVDEVFGWRYENSEIKLARSLSLDLAVPYEMGEDEYIARRESI